MASLTYALVEANNHGWGSTPIVALLVVSVVLTIGFALSQRFGRFPMLTRGLLRNRQFMGASGAFVLFAMGVIGVLFLAVIAFQTMWHFSVDVQTPPVEGGTPTNEPGRAKAVADLSKTCLSPS